MVDWYFHSVVNEVMRKPCLGLPSHASHPSRWPPLRAQSYAERLRLGLAVIHGEAQCAEMDMDDGRHSPPMVKNATVHPGLELPCKSSRVLILFVN